jgi:hypothetical protein
MKRKIFRFTIFWLIFALFFHLLNLAMKEPRLVMREPGLAMQEPSDRWEAFYNLPKDSVDVIFLGNSHNFTSFQPEIIDAIIPVNSYVIGINAENVVVSYYELKEVLKYQHPRVVILETYALNLNDTSKKGYIFEFLDSGRWSINKIAVAARYLTPDTAYTVFPALRTRLDATTLTPAVNQLVRELKYRFSPVADPLAGAAPKEVVIPEAKYLSSLASAVTEFKSPQPDIAVYLKKLYQLCQENNIELVLASAPMLSVTPDQADYFAPFDVSPFVEETGTKYIVFDPADFNRLDYADAAHVSVFGSEVISMAMAQELAEILDVPVDQAALHYYETFEFSDYTLSEESGQYSLALTPVDAAAPLQYRWAIENVDTGAMQSYTEWSSSNSFQFTLPEDGLYRIHVKIRSQSGEHVINAYFPIEKED